MTTVSTDELAIIAGIKAEPESDVPRLVYADWIEEHGRSLQAEFIRVQCELEPIRKKKTSLVKSFKAREDEIAYSSVQDALPSLKKAAPDWEDWSVTWNSVDSFGLSLFKENGNEIRCTIRRGFIEEVSGKFLSLVGGTCSRCRDDGTLIGDPDCPQCDGLGRIEVDYHRVGDCDRCRPVSCPDCGGDKIIKPMLPEIIKWNPVTKVTANDKSPQSVREFLKYYCFWQKSPKNGMTSCQLPSRIFKFLRTGSCQKPRVRHKRYPANQDAHADLSQAMIRWAEEQTLVRGEQNGPSGIRIKGR